VFAALLLRGFSNGAFIHEIIKSKYPNLPSIIGGSTFYYRVILNPEMVEKLMSYLKIKVLFIGRIT